MYKLFFDTQDNKVGSSLGMNKHLQAPSSFNHLEEPPALAFMYQL